MNSRTEGQMCELARRIDPALSPARAVIRIAAMCNTMQAGGPGGYSREMLLMMMAILDVAIQAIDANIAAWCDQPNLLEPPPEGWDAGLS